ncbi:hypothetical protein BRN03_12610 [Xanthomonas oryzae pv. oryzae]|nr:hypothetical protein BRM77_13060 [Xanthomonas oryzae pv. oryzae]AXM29108.1 hypothetical protein BRM78_14295 [Xanthomonas oryzae pv. oryzae]AXM35841.1 hypothetical protein BRM84_09000 [Xanthomonas oryzae pv. oryzae]RBC37280.1 hypothetical protein BRN12_24225 [Xanthomonas oryzae pv. oryzae]RBC56783.1 hypothetical protein BRN09_19470 [Xanthomonas oryzae pv. oryzae]
MGPAHIIVGNSEDIHAVAVAWALERAGAGVVLWDGIGVPDSSVVTHFPTREPLNNAPQMRDTICSE